LIVFSLIAAATSWTSPGQQLREKLLAAGFDVYLLDWGEPDERDAQNRLEDYTDDYIPSALQPGPGTQRRRRGQPLGTASAGC